MKAKKSKTQKARKEKKSEITQLGRALRVLGGYGGGLAGSMFGAPSMGAAAGTGLGAVLSRWLGQGDYSVRSNSLVASLRPDGSIPAMHRNDQSVIVRHKEYVGELRGGQDFKVQYRYPLNPGVYSTFPWLHTVAAQYTEYRIKGMIFHYVPTSGMSVASANTALGSVMFQTSYRATEEPPANKIEMMNEYWASEGRPCDEIVHPIECDPRENPFNIQYVRTNPLEANENILMYDLGVTTVATTGQQQLNGVLGDIWISYEIELKKPRLTGITNESTKTLALLTSTGVTQASPLGSYTLLSSIEGVTASGNVFTFPANFAGEYIMSYAFTSASTLAGLTVTLSAGISQAVTPVTAVGSSSAVYTTVIRFDPAVSVPTTITFGITTLTGTPTVAVRLSEFNSTLL